jgi:hypothetical protein
MEKKEIKLSQVKEIIAEEYARMKKKMAIKSRINQINEELQKMEEEEKLDEVEASGEMKTSSATGLEPGVQHKPKFEKKGSHLLEDDEMEEEMGEFEAKFAEIGKAIDMKLAGEVEDEEGEDESGEFEDVTIEDKPEDEEDSIVVGGEEGEEEEKDEEIEEGGYKETHQDEEGNIVTADDVHESVEEPLEGESVAQMTDADDVNDNMKKDTHVNEGKKTSKEVIAESKRNKGNLLSEGLETKRVQALNEELNRMKRLARLSDDEE